MSPLLRGLAEWLGLRDSRIRVCSTCGHADSSHMHYRGGEDCAECRCVMLLAPASGSIDLKTSEKILGH